MHSQVINEFARAVVGFGLVRAKELRSGQETRLTQARVSTEEDLLRIHNETGTIEIPFDEIQQISFAPNKSKYFVRMGSSIVELRPDDE